VTWLWIVIGIVVVVLLFGIYLFNKIVRLRNEVNTGWSNIDVQLKRRNDLIPNLVEAVKGYAAHERGVFEQVTEARAAMANASSPAAAGAADSLLGQAIGRLFAVAEAYPDLKASENFRQLQSELTDTEDKISAARRYYNATVQAYNTAIQTFPSLVFAGMFGFQAREFFAADQAAGVPPCEHAVGEAERKQPDRAAPADECGRRRGEDDDQSGKGEDDVRRAPSVGPDLLLERHRAGPTVSRRGLVRARSTSGCGPARCGSRPPRTSSRQPALTTSAANTVLGA